MGNTFTARATDKNGKKVVGNKLKILTGIIRMRFLFRWGLVLQEKEDLKKLLEAYCGGTNYLNSVANPSTNFLPPISHYKWIRRPIRDGYLYAYDADDKKISEYSIIDGQLSLIAVDLAQYKATNEKSSWDTRLADIKPEEFWDSEEDNLKGNNSLNKIMFAYSECQWSMSYIEYILDDNNEKLRKERFREIDLAKYYEHFQNNRSSKNNPLNDEELSEYFSLGDKYNYFLKSGNEHNKWEERSFSADIINKYTYSDILTMNPPPPKQKNIHVGNGEFATSGNSGSNDGVNNGNTSNRKPIVISHATVWDPLGALDDIAEDLAMGNARFDALVASLGLSQSPTHILDDALTELGAGREVNLLEQKKELSDQEVIDKHVNEALEEERKNDPIGKDYQKLFTSALLLNKMLYTPEFQNAMKNNEEVRKYAEENKISQQELNRKNDKYRECLQKEKIEKILATKERTEHHDLIMKTRNGLGEMLKFIDSDVVLFDYIENIPSAILEGKKRIGNVIVQLCNLFRGKDRHLDITNEKKEEILDDRLSNWNSLIFSSAYYLDGELLDVTLETFDYALAESQKMMRALFNKLVEITNELGDPDNHTNYKSVGIIFSTHVSLYRYLESQIRLDRLSIQKEITSNTNEIGKQTQNINEAQNEIDESKQKIEKAEHESSKIDKNIAQQQERKVAAEKKLADLKKLEDQFIKRIEENLNTNKETKKIVKTREVTLFELENEISNNEVFAKYSEKKNVAMFGKEIEHCKEEIAKTQEQNKAAREDIAGRESEINELRKQREKIVRGEINPNKNTVKDSTKKIETKEQAVSKIDARIQEHNSAILNQNTRIQEGENTLSKLRSKLSEAESTYGRLKSFKVTQISIKMTKGLERICNTMEFKSGMLVLSFTTFISSFMKMMKDPNTRDAVNMTTCIADMASIGIDVGFSLKGSLKNIDVNPSQAKQARIMARGATKVSMAFGVISSIGGTVGVFMDMHASIMKRDEKAATGYAIAGVISGISAIASFTLLLGSLNMLTLSATAVNVLAICNIYGMLLVLIIIIIISIISDDNFQTFLKATVFSSASPIKDINDWLPERVKNELCGSKSRMNYCFVYKEDLYKVVTIFEGKIDEVKKGLDMANFDNMLGWLYNLIVGFSVDGHRTKDVRRENKIQLINNLYAPAVINLNVVFGGYIEGVSQVESEFRLYPAGVKRYSDVAHMYDESRPYSPLVEPLTEMLYDKITNKKTQRMIGLGYRYEFELDAKFNYLKQQHKYVNGLMRYVLFFRMDIDTSSCWPYRRSYDKEPIYVALTECVANTDTSSNHLLISQYNVISKGGRYTIHDKQAVLLGTKTSILHYLSILEEKLTERFKEMDKLRKL